MKKTLLITILILALSPSLGFAQTRITVNCDPTVTPNCAGNSNGNLGYTPLEPIPGVTTGDVTNPASLPNLINALFRILFTLGALLAVVMLVWGGIEYMTAVAIKNKQEGLRRTQAALWGMLLLAGAWLILNTINPNLLKFTLNPCPAGSNCTITSVPSSSAGGSAFATSDPNPISCSPSDVTCLSKAQSTKTSQCNAQNGGVVQDVPGPNETTMVTCTSVQSLSTPTGGATP